AWNQAKEAKDSRVRKSSDIVGSDELSGECNLGSPLREIRTAFPREGMGFKNSISRPIPTHHSSSSCGARLGFAQRWPVEGIFADGHKNRPECSRFRRRTNELRPRSSPLTACLPYVSCAFR